MVTLFGETEAFPRRRGFFHPIAATRSRVMARRRKSDRRIGAFRATGSYVLTLEAGFWYSAALRPGSLLPD
jgi:hypothetical protein